MTKNNINNDRNAGGRGGGCNDDYEFDEFGGISCFSIRVDMEVEVSKE